MFKLVIPLPWSDNLFHPSDHLRNYIRQQQADDFLCLNDVVAVNGI